MRKTILIIFILVLSSCNDNTRGNYQMIKNILQYPDIIDSILNDTNLTSKHYKEYALDKNNIEKLKKYISDYFQNDLDILRDKIYNLTGDKFVFLYKIHTITLLSSKDKSKKLYFCFADESNKKIWKLDEILFYDPFIDGSPQSRISG